jgi:putative lipoprotein
MPAAETDTATGTRSYRARTGAYDLRVLIEPARCTDAMSGQPYETTVTVTLEGKAYHGCGGPLP